MSGITLALDRNFGSCVLDLGEVVFRQRDVHRAKIFLQPMQLRRAGDRHDPRLLRQQPGERDLRRGCLLFVGNALEQVNERLVFLHRLRREARKNLAEVIFAEFGFLRHRTG
jgi:hypothetical protein